MAETYWLKQLLKECKLTPAAAARQCGVSFDTMAILLGGRPTLPCLALKVGKGLRLTQEQVKLLGQHLRSPNWGRNGLPKPPPEDTDPEWWRRHKVK